MKKNENGLSVILASGSPRRRELIASRGLDHYVMPVDTVETLPRSMDGREAVMHLALKKAFAALEELGRRGIASPADLPFMHPEHPCFILAADTVVWDGRILGKPASRAEALEMLMCLSGGHHSVYTGCALFSFDRSEKLLFCDESEVYFKKYTEADISDYLDTPEPYDKAGAYAVQGYFSRFTERVEGSRDNVIGLPVDRVISAAKSML